MRRRIRASKQSRVVFDKELDEFRFASHVAVVDSRQFGGTNDRRELT